MASEVSANHLDNKTKIGYAAGHIFNDIAASLRTSYSLIFYQNVLKIDKDNVGMIYLFGQLADGFTSPLVGYMSDIDMDVWMCNTYGRRKTWHLVGVLFVLIGWPALFLPPVGVDLFDNITAITAYYSLVNIIYNLGFAIVQNAHLAMIPELSLSDDVRISLSLVRNSMTSLANILGYVGALIAFTYGPINGQEAINSFKNLMLIGLGFGLTSSIVFHVFTKENRKKPVVVNDDQDCSCSMPTIHEERLTSFFGHVSLPIFIPSALRTNDEEKMRPKDWFQNSQYYLIGLIYLSSRLIFRVSLTYIVYYIEFSLNLEKKFIAIVPVVMFTSGLVIAPIVELAKKRIGMNVIFIISCILGLVACLEIWIGCQNDAICQYEINVIAILLGASISTHQTYSLSMIACLVGPNIESSGFVYGSMSFVEKIAVGAAIMLIQKYMPDLSFQNNAFILYFKWVLAFGCGGMILLSLFLFAILMHKRIGKRRDSGQMNERYSLLPVNVSKYNQILKIIKCLRKCHEI